MRPQTQSDCNQQRGGAASELFRLQVEQFQHDEAHHREIARLTVQHRLNHMTLHLAKYLGVIASGIGRADTADKTARAIVDSFIIIMSTANILNIRIADSLIAEGQGYSDISVLASHFSKATGLESFDPVWLLRSMAIPVGRMAKACESVDHLEAFAFRETLIESVGEIARLLLSAMGLVRIDPAPAVRARLQGVKGRSIFHGQQ